MANHLPIPYTPPPASPPSPYYGYAAYPAPPVVVMQPQPAQDRAGARSVAELGMGVIKHLLGVAALCLGLVATLWMLGLAFALAVTFGEGLKLALIAIGASLALAGLPIAAALLSRNYPGEARRAMQGWAAVVAVAVVGASYFTLTLTPPATHQASLADAERQARQAVPRAVWVFSDGCRDPENDYQASWCREFRQRAARPAPPAISALPFGGEAASSPARKLLVAILNVIALAGAGLLGRLYVLATAEAVRLPNGEAQPAPQGAAAGSLREAQDAALTPLEVFNMWYNGRVRHDPSGRLPALAAFEDYVAACNINGFAHVTQQKFGQLLSGKAQNSGGRIGKVKSNGNNFYTGIAFAGDAAPVDIAAEPSQNGLGAAPIRS